MTPNHQQVTGLATLRQNLVFKQTNDV